MFIKPRKWTHGLCNMFLFCLYNKINLLWVKCFFLSSECRGKSLCFCSVVFNLQVPGELPVKMIFHSAQVPIVQLRRGQAKVTQGSHRGHGAALHSFSFCFALIQLPVKVSSQSLMISYSTFFESWRSFMCNLLQPRTWF